MRNPSHHTLCLSIHIQIDEDNVFDWNVLSDSTVFFYYPSQLLSSAALYAMYYTAEVYSCISDPFYAVLVCAITGF